MNMTIVGAKRQLLDGLNTVRKASPEKSTVPLHLLALIESEGPEQVRVTVTDGPLTMATTIAVNDASLGGFLVHYRDLRKRLEAMPDGPVCLRSKEGQLAVEGAGSARRYRLPTVAREDYPSVVQPEGAAFASLPASAWRKLVNLTAFAASKEESRPYLTGVLFEWDGAVARMVATDGRRLAMTDIEVPGAQASVSALLPVSAAKAIASIPAKEGDALRIEGRRDELIAELGATRLRAALLDGHFPPYERVLPQNPSALTVGRELLLASLRAVQLAAGEAHGVRLTIRPTCLRVATPHGDASDEVPCDADAAGEVGLRADYLIDVLSELATDEVVLRFGSSTGALSVEPVRAAGVRHTSVIMPMHLPGAS